MSKALIGELSIDLGDGVTLTASTDVELARKWAAYLHGAAAWQAMSLGRQSIETSNALHALRTAAQGVGE